MTAAPRLDLTDPLGATSHGLVPPDGMVLGPVAAAEALHEQCVLLLRQIYGAEEEQAVDCLLSVAVARVGRRQRPDARHGP